MLEEEIDIRPYIIALAKKWWLILITAVAGFLLAFGFSSLSQPIFSATSLITIQDPQDLIEIDSSISDLQRKQPLDAFPELALSDEVLADTISLLDQEGITTITEIRESLASESGSDDSVIRLTARSSSPELSARMSNAWATAFTDWANLTYGGQNDQQVLFFEEQLTNATEQLDLAQEAIESFEKIDESLIISNTLAAHTQAHLSYVQQQLQIEQIVNDVESLKEQIESRPETIETNLSDQLAFLQLQLSSLNEESQLPFIVDVADSSLITTSNREDHLLIIDSLISALEGKEAVIDGKIDELEPQILELQQQRRRFMSDRDRLLTNLGITSETVRVLTFQVAEERIASQNQGDGFQIASRAVATAVTSNEQSQLPTALIGFFLGAMLGVLIIIGTFWWQRE